MHELFDCEVSLLDHTIGVSVFLAAVALDETVIKKNF
jgi:sialic acid synthase SpsE